MDVRSRGVWERERGRGRLMCEGGREEVVEECSLLLPLSCSPSCVLCVLWVLCVCCVCGTCVWWVWCVLFSCDSVCWAWARLSLYACTIKGSSCAVRTYGQSHKRKRIEKESKMKKRLEEDDNRNLFCYCLYFATENYNDNYTNDNSCHYCCNHYYQYYPQKRKDRILSKSKNYTEYFRIKLWQCKGAE